MFATRMRNLVKGLADFEMFADLSLLFTRKSRSTNIRQLRFFEVRKKNKIAFLGKEIGKKIILFL